MPDVSERKCEVNPALEHLLRPLSELREDPRNARRHDERNVAAIAASLRRFGQQKPIVALPDGTVIAGNGTLRAARTLGWTHLAAVTFDRREAAEALGYAVADNRTGELADWDERALAELLSELNAANDGELLDFGFTDEEFMELLARVEAEGGAPAAQVVAADVADGPAPTRRDAADDVPPDEQGETAPVAQIKYVQLFLDEAEHEKFLERAKYLAALYGTTNLTDTVVEALRRQYEAERSAAGEG